MLFKSSLLFIVGGLNLLIGLLVLIREPKKLQNRLFFLFSLSLAGWVIGIAGFLLVNDPRPALYWARLYYIFPLLIAASMPLFSYTFPSRDRLPGGWLAFILIGLIGVGLPIVTLPHILTERIVYFDWGKDVILNKTYYLVYSVYLLMCFGLGLVHMYLKSRRLGGTARLQAYFFFIGFLLTSAFGVLFNLIYPWFGNYRLIWLGPLFTNAFIIATGYSIIRHKMFDIKLVAARAFAYVFSLTVLATVYGFVVFGILKLFFDRDYRVSTQIVISVATALAAIGFSSIKGFFDRITNTLFYHDAYDTQELLDRLNRLFVTKTDLNRLLKDSAAVIAESFKAEQCYFGIKESDTTPQRIIGSGSHKVSAEDVERVRHVTPHIHHKIIVSDELDDSYAQLKQALIANNIAILGRLTANTHLASEGLGYLVLGPRRSGNPYTARDIRTLEIIVNELVIAIENSLRFEQIQHFNETLQENVSDATRKLRTTNDKLKALDATKDDFITMASHQLRTPLTAVKGYLSMVLEGDAGKLNAQQQKLLEQSYLSSQRMVYLIADLLNLSRINTGKFVIQPSSVNLAQVVQTEVDQLEETAKSRDVSLTYEAPAAFPELMLDETKIHQVVMNFIDNAIYYTPSGGHIRIELHETPSAVEYRVHDDGIGVPKSEQHKLFTKFYRAGNARQARPDGTGLGLFMARKVVAAQGGAIIFQSTEGKGSTFGFRFTKRNHAVPVEDNTEQSIA